MLSTVTETSRDSPDRPPNSAPLPAKFASSLGHSEKPNSQHAGAVVLPHNLLRLQLQKKSLIDCDTSSAGMGSFNNYVDTFFSLFDHPPTPRRQ